MHLFWKRSAQVSPHRSDRTLIQNFAAAAPRQGAPPGCQQAWPNPNQIRLERKRIENLSYIRPSQNLCHPERCPNRAGAARRVEGLAVVSGDRGSGRNRVPVDGAQARKPRPTLQLVRRNEHPCPVSPTGDVIMRGGLCTAKERGAPCDASRFLPGKNARSARILGGRAPSQITLVR